MLRQFRLSSSTAVQIAAGAAFCVVFGSLFWRAATEPAAVTGHSQCRTISDDAQRLACIEAFQRASAGDTGQMLLGKIPTRFRAGEDRDTAQR